MVDISHVTRAAKRIMSPQLMASELPVFNALVPIMLSASPPSDLEASTLVERITVACEERGLWPGGNFVSAIEDASHIIGTWKNLNY